MATTHPPKKPAKPAEGYQRDHAREAAGRATSKQVNLWLNEDEHGEVMALVAEMNERREHGEKPVPVKAAVLAAVRAARAALEGGTYPAVRKALRSDLEPAKPGPKPADDRDE